MRGISEAFFTDYCRLRTADCRLRAGGMMTAITPPDGNKMGGVGEKEGEKRMFNDECSIRKRE